MSDVISNITEALIEAAESQAAATNAINASEDDIKMAEDILKQVGNLWSFYFALSSLLV